MKELQLKYGCNPNQKPSRIYMKEVYGKGKCFMEIIIIIMS